MKKKIDFKNIVGDYEADDDDEDDDDKKPLEIEITRVKGPCLAKVVDFMKHYKGEKMKTIPTPLGGSSFNEVRFTCFFSFRSKQSKTDTIFFVLNWNFEH